MLRQFYGDVLPAQGHYALFRGKTKQHVWAPGLDELTQQTESRIDEPDLYFATASFQAPTSRTQDNALFRRALCFDIDAGEAKFAKHGDKVYETQSAAVSALLAYAKETRTVPHYLLSSGNGLHAYFLLDQDVPVADWLPVATALKAQALAMGLRIDPAVTADAARVLRPPGTLHHSGARVVALGTSPHARYALAALAEKLAPWAVAPKREKSKNSLFLDAPQGPPKVLAKVTEHCAAMRHAVNARGDVSEPFWRAMLGVIKFTEDGEAAAHAASEGHPDYDYHATQAKLDRWTAGPTTCDTFAGEVPELCGTCKFRGKVKSPIMLGELNIREQAQRPAPAPAPQPEPVEEQAPAEEAWGSTEDVAPAPKAPWTGRLPDGYRIDQVGIGYVLSGLVELRDDDPAEEGAKKARFVWKPFGTVPFWFESWAPGVTERDPAMAVFCAYNALHRTVTRFTMPTKYVAERNALLGALAAQNIQVIPSGNQQKTMMEDYVKASLERIRYASQRSKINERFGAIYTDHNKLIVAQGRHLIHGDGHIYEGVPSDTLRSRSNAYLMSLGESDSGHWTPDVWATDIMPKARRHIQFLEEFYGSPNFRPYQMSIMLALASPLMPFMQGMYKSGKVLPEGSGLTVTLFSPKSGIGKTAAMHAAALAFGNPSDLVNQLDQGGATDNARMMITAISGTMPVFMDEMEDLVPEKVANIISSVANGVVKIRLDKDSAPKDGQKISLVVTMSTNRSQREAIEIARPASPAVHKRVLEIDCSDVAPVSPERRAAAQKAKSEVLDCAGALGGVLHLCMARMGGANLNRLGLEFTELATKYIPAQDNRFMARAMGAMLLAHKILSQAGLPLFDAATLQAEFLKRHEASERHIGDVKPLPTTPKELLSLMVSELAPKTLVTMDRTTSNGRFGAAHVYDKPLNDRVPDDVQARGVLRHGYVLVKLDAIRSWAFGRRMGYHAVLNMAREIGAFELTGPNASEVHTVDLLGGTQNTQGVRVRAVKILLSRLDAAMAGAALVNQAVDNVRPLRATDRIEPDPGTDDRASGPV